MKVELFDNEVIRSTNGRITKSKKEGEKGAIFERVAAPWASSQHIVRSDESGIKKYDLYHALFM